MWLKEQTFSIWVLFLFKKLLWAFTLLPRLPSLLADFRRKTPANLSKFLTPTSECGSLRRVSTSPQPSPWRFSLSPWRTTFLVGSSGRSTPPIRTCMTSSRLRWNRSRRACSRWTVTMGRSSRWGAWTAASTFWTCRWVTAASRCPSTWSCTWSSWCPRCCRTPSPSASRTCPLRTSWGSTCTASGAPCATRSWPRSRTACTSLASSLWRAPASWTCYSRWRHTAASSTSRPTSSRSFPTPGDTWRTRCASRPSWRRTAPGWTVKSSTASRACRWTRTRSWPTARPASASCARVSTGTCAAPAMVSAVWSVPSAARVVGGGLGYRPCTLVSVHSLTGPPAMCLLSVRDAGAAGRARQAWPPSGGVWSLWAAGSTSGRALVMRWASLGDPIKGDVFLKGLFSRMR